ncbi:MAG: hypothetical protein M1816_004804 [Peltula sp. TS41687]|nr:MAG: hypothetical protein M1816_004804 [Peltula sp. TS41687]
MGKCFSKLERNPEQAVYELPAGSNEVFELVGELPSPRLRMPAAFLSREMPGTPTFEVDISDFNTKRVAEPETGLNNVNKPLPDLPIEGQKRARVIQKPIFRPLSRLIEAVVNTGILSPVNPELKECYLGEIQSRQSTAISENEFISVCFVPTPKTSLQMIQSGQERKGTSKPTLSISPEDQTRLMSYPASHSLEPLKYPETPNFRLACDFDVLFIIHGSPSMSGETWLGTVEAVRQVASKCQVQYDAAEVHIEQWRDNLVMEESGIILPRHLLNSRQEKQPKPLELIVISLDNNRDIFWKAVALVNTDRHSSILKAPLHTHFMQVRKGKFSKTEEIWECDSQKLEQMLHNILRNTKGRHERYVYPTVDWV